MTIFSSFYRKKCLKNEFWLFFLAQTINLATGIGVNNTSSNVVWSRHMPPDCRASSASPFGGLNPLPCTRFSRSRLEHSPPGRNARQRSPAPERAGIILTSFNKPPPQPFNMSQPIAACSSPFLMAQSVTRPSEAMEMSDSPRSFPFRSSRVLEKQCLLGPP